MAAFTFPGVYIQEIPSGVHTITGVATSIAAFVGWSAQGPTDKATLVQSWNDFASAYGGLDPDSYLGYAVNQFFANGGQQAYIVRLADATAQAASLTIIGLTFTTADSWKPSNSYSLGDLVQDSNGNVERCTTAGTSAATAPTNWATSVSATTTDGTVTWTMIGKFTQTPSTVEITSGTANPWQASTAYAVGNLVTDSNGNVEQCTTAGTSGATAPTNWATAVGNTTTDGGVTWTLVGSLTLVARNPGSWGDSYGIRIQPNPGDYTRFTLSVLYTDPTTSVQSVVETFPNLSLTAADPQGRYVVNIINEKSNYLEAAVPLTTPLALTNVPSPAATDPAKLPPPGTASQKLTGGGDGTILRPATSTGSPGAFETALNATGSNTGVHLLDTVFFNLLSVPGEAQPQTISDLQAYCVGERAFLIVDSDAGDTFASLQGGPNSLMSGANAINSALYFPWVNSFDPIQKVTRAFPPAGFVAGLYAATDASRNVWKAPAGINANLSGESGLAIALTDPQNGTLNVQAINCLRKFPVYGDVIWGARTLRGNDQVGSEWKYVPIRRFALFLESSLYEGTQWVVFEPNDERLWGQIRMNVGAFMQGLFLKGAFQGTTPQQAYFVKCDGENNPQPSIDQGIVNILVGFAPLYPAEFVIIQIQQMAGQL